MMNRYEEASKELTKLRNMNSYLSNSLAESSLQNYLNTTTNHTYRKPSNRKGYFDDDDEDQSPLESNSYSRSRARANNSNKYESHDDSFLSRISEREKGRDKDLSPFRSTLRNS